MHLDRLRLLLLRLLLLAVVLIVQIGHHRLMLMLLLLLLLLKRILDFVDTCGLLDLHLRLIGIEVLLARRWRPIK